MTRLPDPRVIRTAVAVLTIAVGIALTPGRASATCGDYVLIAGQSSEAQHQNHKLSTAPGESPGNPESPRVPCHGPGCSKSPTDSIPPITAPIGGEADPKNPPATLGGAGPGDGGVSRERDFTSNERAVHLPTTIFHPPRAVQATPSDSFRCRFI